MAGAFDKAKHRAIDKALAIYATRQKADGDQQDIAQRIRVGLDLSEFENIVDPMSDALGDMAADGATVALRQISMIGDESIVALANDAAVEWSLDRAAELVGRIRDAAGRLVDNPNPRWSISESTRDMVAERVTTAMSEGWSNDELSNALQDGYEFSAQRADMIARTETAFADVQGNMAAYDASGVVSKKEWITANDDQVSDDCAMNAAQGPIPFDDSFQSGASAPPEHPNCRCDILPVLDQEESQ